MLFSTKREIVLNLPVSLPHVTEEHGLKTGLAAAKISL
jgi:hypothetical protein